MWGWSLQPKEDDKSAAGKKEGVEGLKRSHVSSDESGTTEAEEKSSKFDGAQPESRIDREDKEELDTERNLFRPDKFRPRRYYIKMQVVAFDVEKSLI